MGRSPWIVVDTSCLAYRSMHAMGELEHEGVGTAVTFGVFRTVVDLMELFCTRRVAWCFDRGYGKRTDISATYKHNRKDRTEEEAACYREVARQIYRMRTDYLPRIGFRNLLWQDDYEADDVIASVCGELRRGEEAVIVSSDSDLFQLLRQDVISMWLPHRKAPVTEASFTKEWGVSPSVWSDVKAIAGCPGDGVVGIRGVGEKTACKFLQGRLKTDSKAYAAIVGGDGIWRRNLPLVRLPFPGIEAFGLIDAELDPDEWDAVADELGMKTLKGALR